jgi:hypothetical protein
LLSLVFFWLPRRVYVLRVEREGKESKGKRKGEGESGERRGAEEEEWLLVK